MLIRLVTSWVAAVIGIITLGVYVYASTFVEGSMTGLNPFGILTLVACLVLAVGLFNFGLKLLLHKIGPATS